MRLFLRDLWSGLGGHMWATVATVLLVGSATGIAVGVHHINAAARDKVLQGLNTLGADVRIISSNDPVGTRQLSPGAADRIREDNRVVSVIEIERLRSLIPSPTEITPPLSGTVGVTGLGITIGSSLPVEFGEFRIDPDLPIGVIGIEAFNRLGLSVLPTSVAIRTSEQSDVAFDVVITGVLTNDPLIVQLRDSIVIDARLASQWRGPGDKTEVYVRSSKPIDESKLIRYSDPMHPEIVTVSRPVALEEALSRSDLVLGGVAEIMTRTMAVAAAISISVMLSYSVRQRTPEIGLRRCLGASGSSIVAAVTGESLAIGLAGSVVGTSTGLTTAVIWANIRRWPLTIDETFMATSTVWGIGIGIAAGVVPAILAVRVDPAVAISAEI